MITSTKLQRAKTLRSQATPAEAVLWRALRRNQLDGLHFRRQQVIDGFIVDFYCHAAGLVIELDGPIHEGQQDHDQARDEVLRQHQLTVLRLNNEEVLNDLAGCFARIRALCGT
jgi:very-short-patch-repair endonuclease